MPRSPLSELEIELDPVRFDELTAACVTFVRTQLEGLANAPAADLEGAEALRRAFIEPMPESGAPIEAILERLGPAVAKSLTTAGPGYLAYIPGGGLYASALADYVALSVNRYVGVSRAAPALAQIERTTLDWLSELMGYPTTSRGLFTSGGSMSNLIAIVTARSTRLPPDVPLSHARIYVSRETHVSVRKAARIAGFPDASVRAIDVDARCRLDLRALEIAIAEDRRAGALPFMIVVNAGTTNSGAVDPIESALRVAAREELWVHADAAYGGFFRLVPESGALLAPLASCDSITLDPHKGLFLPYGTGCLLVRDGHALYQAHRSDAAYLNDVAGGDEIPDFTDLSPELSRDFRGLRLWLPLMLHGLAPFREALAEKLRLARLAHAELTRHTTFELESEPDLSVVALRLRDDDATRGDARSAELLRRVNARGRVHLSSTVIRGRFTLRICVLSFRTHEERVREAISNLVDEAKGL